MPFGTCFHATMPGPGPGPGCFLFFVGAGTEGRRPSALLLENLEVTCTCGMISSRAIFPRLAWQKGIQYSACSAQSRAPLYKM
jgi:hypothetical protein